MDTEPAFTIEPFIGHRVWRVVPLDGGPALASATSADPWSVPRQRAVCHAGVLQVPHDRPHLDRHAGAAPELECTCGIYATRRPMAPPHRRVWAAGTVRMWGRVVEASKGFRSEWAELDGDLAIMLGMGPGTARCTHPICRGLAERVVTGKSSYLSRCRSHARDGIEIGAFVDLVGDSFERRYGVAVTLASPMPS